MLGSLAALRSLNCLQHGSVESGTPSYDLKTCESLQKDLACYKILKGIEMHFQRSWDSRSPASTRCLLKLMAAAHSAVSLKHFAYCIVIAFFFNLFHPTTPLQVDCRTSRQKFVLSLYLSCPNWGCHAVAGPQKCLLNTCCHGEGRFVEAVVACTSPSLFCRSSKISV